MLSKERHRDEVICVVTWWKSSNYGTCLQCYALVKYLELLNFKVVVPETLDYYYGFSHPIETVRLIAKKIGRCFFPSSQEKEVKERKNQLTLKRKQEYKIRLDKNLDFAYRQCRIYRIPDKKAYRKMLDEADVFVTGSDQIWNPSYIKTTFLLSMADDKPLKIAYGSSLGISYIPPRMKRLYRKYLNRFHAIGVREKTAEKNLDKILNNNVETVLDPTFLLTRESWQQLAENAGPKAKKMAEKPYVFCYFIGKNRNWESHAGQFAGEQNFAVYNILSESYVIADIGISVADLGIEDFIYLLINAQCVVTDSFHATALSINLQKEVVVYKRFQDHEVESQNSRITDLLEMFEMSEKLIQDEQQWREVYQYQTDYCRVGALLKEKRIGSIDFLNRALNR